MSDDSPPSQPGSSGNGALANVAFDRMLRDNVPFSGRTTRPDALARSYLTLDMHIRAMTCRDVVRGKTTFWLHSLGRSGVRAVRRRSLVIKELSSSTPSLVFLATFFGRFCEVFAGHRLFTADTPT